MSIPTPSAVIQPFTKAHTNYVKGLYRRSLKSSLDWIVVRPVWRQQAIEIRTRFERNRDVRDPRQLAKLLQDAEEEVTRGMHPDPYIPSQAADGTKWERNLPPPIFSAEIRHAAREAFLADKDEERILAECYAEAEAESAAELASQNLTGASAPGS